MREDLKPGTRISHEKYGEGVISRNTLSSYSVIFIRAGEVQFSKSRAEFDILEEVEGEEQAQGSSGISLQEIEKALASVLDRYQGLAFAVEMAEKWEGGTILLQPGDTALQPKELPIETFFHKIVMVRDRLRVLEQHINSHTGLGDADKVQLQQYITRIYGSLTTFNILFAEKDDYFTGMKT